MRPRSSSGRIQDRGSRKRWAQGEGGEGRVDEGRQDEGGEGWWGIRYWDVARAVLQRRQRSEDEGGVDGLRGEISAVVPGG